jgi:arabinofuranosyltransferase
MRRHALLGAAFVVLLLHAWFFHHTCDDAFISFRYAHNLARGHGLVFNVGERVMGYSNLLWVLLLAAFEVARIPSPIAAPILGAIFALGTLVVVERHARHPWVAMGMLAFNATFAMWIFGGLEGHLFAFLLTFAVTRAIERRSAGAIGVAMGLLCMTRPEGIVYLVPLFVFLVFVQKAPKKALLRVFVPALAIYGAQTLFIFLYYGDVVPNTYYAKSEPLAWNVIVRGISLTWRYLAVYLGVPAILFVLGLHEAIRHNSERCVLPLLVIATFVAFYVRIGGDVLVYHRLWIGTLPMNALIASEIAERLGSIRPSLKNALASIFVLSGLSASRGADLEYLRKEDANLVALRRAAESMRAYPRDTVIAANVVGILTYGSELRMVDMLGLTDVHVARAPNKAFGLPGHESHDGKYVLDRRPDLIFYGYPLIKRGGAPLEAKPLYPPDFDLARDPRLQKDYELVRLSFPEGDLAVYRRKGFVP